MAPILIDIRDLIKLGILSVLTIVLAFAGGFQFGSQQAKRNSDFGAVTAMAQLSQPEESETLVIDIVRPASETSQVSESFDVAQVEHPVEQVAVVKQVTTRVKPETEASDKVSEQAADKKPEPVKVELSETTIKEQVPDKKELTGSAATLAVSHDGKIKYSIQAAVYGRLNNAENMMDKLQAEKLDAYISDYINKSNKVRFNVRFGYFKDKKTALSALQDYIDNQKGDGYLVNYSAKNIVAVAQATEVTGEPAKEPEVAEQPVTIVQADNESATVAMPASIPESIPVEIIPDNVSQVENTDTANELKTVQGNTQIN